MMALASRAKGGTRFSRYRKLSVEMPAVDWRVIWVECDEDGKPIRTTYKPERGDVPADSKGLLPWKTEYLG